MRRFALLFVIAAASCTAHTKVSGELLIDHGKGAPQRYAYEAIEAHDLTGLAIGCAATAVFYGGACWAYIAVPFDGHERAALDHAREDAPRIGRCASLVGLAVSGVSADAATGRRVVVRSAGGRELDQAAIDALCTPPTGAATTDATTGPAS